MFQSKFPFKDNRVLSYLNIPPPPPTTAAASATATTAAAAATTTATTTATAAAATTTTAATTIMMMMKLAPFLFHYRAGGCSTAGWKSTAVSTRAECDPLNPENILEIERPNATITRKAAVILERPRITFRSTFGAVLSRNVAPVDQSL